MQKRMMHPDPLQWGFASGPAEEASMRAHGWVDDVPATAKIVAVETKATEPEAAPAAPVKVAKKPGRKPKAVKG